MRKKLSELVEERGQNRSNWELNHRRDLANDRSSLIDETLLATQQGNHNRRRLGRIGMAVAGAVFVVICLAGLGIAFSNTHSPSTTSVATTAATSGSTDSVTSTSTSKQRATTSAPAKVTTTTHYIVQETTPETETPPVDLPTM